MNENVQFLFSLLQEEGSKPLNIDLIDIIGKLNDPKIKEAVTAKRLKDLEVLLRFRLCRRAPYVNWREQNYQYEVSSTLVDLKDTEENRQYLWLYDVLIDIKVLSWSIENKCWERDWEMMGCWILALLVLMVDWGIGYRALMDIIRVLLPDEKDQSLFRNTVQESYKVLAQCEGLIRDGTGHFLYRAIT
ncbi:hypothetical protein HBI81_062170 [Parastagonospora nodorum]|nr:hypothetical protein HBH52_121460 [Parastagonospora nodorum]KAH3984678.1 hypothetical protein HBH51_027330 [Parastagonospora nodorum]KAH4000318.1 hypothetical protein HBI10_100110 [Parastagonospora nodorum]KAH4026691.1 hypothetical protein HBI13_065500 [Parastagonospora nodorum]KAH4036757.1 hypothetical protein HBI09_077010 [Parastagonospora nodorum]